jgi:hypothetical protein
MLWLGYRLPVELENQFGMARGSNISGKILVTSHTDTRSDIKVAKVPHSGLDPVSIGPIVPGMGAQPGMRGTMATLACHPLRDGNASSQLSCRQGLKGRMANRAGKAMCRIADFHYLRDAFGPGRFKRGARAEVVEVILRPGCVLVLIVTGAAVTTGGTAALGSKESR